MQAPIQKQGHANTNSNMCKVITKNENVITVTACYTQLDHFGHSYSRLGLQSY